MNTGAETKPVDIRHSAGTFFSIRWSWKKICLFAVFVFAAHVAFIFVLGTPKPVQPRVAKDIPTLQFDRSANEFIALEDPTLFAQPHAQDFVPAVWRRMPDVTHPSIRWTEPPPYLPPAVEMLGATFKTFMASNQFTRLSLDFKPSPVLNTPKIQFISLMPKSSSLSIEGALSKRPLLEPVTVPTLAYNDVISPSRVQVLVDQAGNVISAVSLPSESAIENAGRAEIGDTNALTIARGLRFTPGSGLTLGELIFEWHTMPVAHTTTNAP